MDRVATFGRHKIIAGLEKVSKIAEEGEKFLVAKTSKPPAPEPSVTSHGRVVAPATQTTSTPSTHKAASTAPKKFHFPTSQTPPPISSRTADPLRPPLNPVPSSSVSMLTSQWEQNSNASQPPMPSTSSTPKPYSPIKKTTTSSLSVNASTTPLVGTRPAGSKPVPHPAPVPTVTSNASTKRSDAKPFESKPLPRPPAPTESSSAPAIKPSRVAYAPSSYTSSPYTPSPQTPTPAPSSLYSTSHTPAPSSLYRSATPAPAPVSVAPIKTVESDLVINPPEYIWLKVRAHRERIASLDVQPACDAGNIIVSGFPYGDEVAFKLDLNWKLCYSDESGVNREVQFTSCIYKTDLMPTETASVGAKNILWKAYLSLLAYTYAAQKSLNPAHQGTDLWDRPLNFIQSNGVICQNRDAIAVNSKDFTLQVKFAQAGCNDFSFPVHLSKLPQFTLAKYVVPTPIPVAPKVSPDAQTVKATPISWTLSADELAALKAHPLYPRNSLSILEAQWTPSGQRDYIAEVKAIHAYLKLFAKGERALWSVKCLADNIEKWEMSGTHLPLPPPGKSMVDLSLTYFNLDYFPEEQRKLIGSHIAIKEYELRYLILKNAQGANMSDYERKWAKKGGSEITGLVWKVRDGQIDGSINNQAMLLLQRQIPKLKDYMSIFNTSLDSKTSCHYNNDLQQYHPEVHAQEMREYEQRQRTYVPARTVHRWEPIGSNDVQHGSHVRQGIHSRQIAESVSGGYSYGGSTSLTTPVELRHYGWVLADDGVTREVPKASQAECTIM